MELEKTKGLYGQQLAENIKNQIPTATVQYSLGKIFLYLESTIGEKASLKGWLHMLLESLPDIQYPLERIEFAVYEEGSMKLMTIINP